MKCGTGGSQGPIKVCHWIKGTDGVAQAGREFFFLLHPYIFTCIPNSCLTLSHLGRHINWKTWTSIHFASTQVLILSLSWCPDTTMNSSNSMTLWGSDLPIIICRKASYKPACSDSLNQIFKRATRSKPDTVWPWFRFLPFSYLYLTGTYLSFQAMWYCMLAAIGHYLKVKLSIWILLSLPIFQNYSYWQSKTGNT